MSIYLQWIKMEADMRDHGPEAMAKSLKRARFWAAERFQHYDGSGVPKINLETSKRLLETSQKLPCADMNCQCQDCASLDCPYGELFHYHHDGCPTCSEISYEEFESLLSGVKTPRLIPGDDFYEGS
mgnify:CR=1 FL=1